MEKLTRCLSNRAGDNFFCVSPYNRRMTDNSVKRVGACVLAFSIITLPFFAFAADPLVPCGQGTDQCEFNDIIILINNVVNFLIKSIALPVSAVLFAWAGFLYLTNAGKKGQVEKAHEVFLNTFVGLVLTLVGWLVINLITKLLTGKDVGSFLPS